MKIVIIVTDFDTNSKHEVEFDSREEASEFKAMAEEDGSYYGQYTRRG